MRPILSASLVGLALLAGCAYPSPQHVAALNTLIGKSETDLVRAHGVPTRTYETGGSKFLSYNMNHIESIPGDYGFGGFGPGYGGFGYGGFGYGGLGYGGFGGFGPEIVQRDCDTTFELKTGVVQSWSLRGNDC